MISKEEIACCIKDEIPVYFEHNNTKHYGIPVFIDAGNVYAVWREGIEKARKAHFTAKPKDLKSVLDHGMCTFVDINSVELLDVEYTEEYSVDDLLIRMGYDINTSI